MPPPLFLKVDSSCKLRNLPGVADERGLDAPNTSGELAGARDGHASIYFREPNRVYPDG